MKQNKDIAVEEVRLSDLKPTKSNKVPKLLKN